MEQVINPFRNLRLSADLTLGELAAYSRIDIRALNRSEYGMYTNPLPGLVDYWVTRGRISEGVLVSEYEDYQLAIRKFNHLLFGPMLDFDPTSKIHPLRQFRHRCQFGLVDLCKALCLPLDTVQYFEKKWRVQKSVPKGLILALNQAGYTQTQLQEFKHEYALWRESQSKITFT
jgi:hypothetical protein